MKSIKIIPSKSDAHRAMICAALSKEPCEILCEATSEDIEATIDCLVALKVGGEVMECGESGSTLRFLLPVMGALGHKAAFMPKGRLPERPLSPLYEELQAHGCTLSQPGSVPFVIQGKLQPGVYTIPGTGSSQFITGLLLALPILDGDSQIIIEGPLESKGYVDLTLGVIEKFGIKVDALENGFAVKGNQVYQGPAAYQVEGDWSNAAFWLAAGVFLQEGLLCEGLREDSLQGDKKIVEMLKAFGAKASQDENSVNVYGGKLHGIEIDASPIPDMVPTLALLGSVATGSTVIKNAGRLRIKESDRLKTVAATLNALGADITETADGLIINGREKLKGGSVDGCGDHRIVMMAAIASLVCEDKVHITGAGAVRKSYPNFFQEMKRLGIDDKLCIINERK